MTPDEVTRMAREAGYGWSLADMHFPALMRFAALVAAAERNKLAEWMMEQGYATGHGDNMEEMLNELDWQIRESEREACAKLCEDAISSIWEFHPEYVNEVGRNVCTNLAAAIRARGESK